MPDATLPPVAHGTEPTVGIDHSTAPTLASVAPGTGSGSATPHFAPGQSLGERYEILSVLGEGGCGVVYKARDRELDRTVAIKTIHPAVAANPKALERFKRETLLASQITHRNVVRIHDMGEVGPVKFISMAFIEGTDLKTIIQKEGPLSLERALPLIRQIGEALQAAHAAGIVHRDLKPQNVLVDAAGQAYIADFGISRSIDHGQTMTEAGAVMGTLAYMSPEQARGDTADHRSDIYSLGLIIYEMLTGTQPFQSGNLLSQLMKRVESDVPTVDLTRSDLPAWLVRVVARASAREPDRRYQSVADFLEDLGREQATRARRRVAAGKTVKRVGAVALVAAAAGLGAYFWLHREPSAAPAVRASLMILPFGNVTRDPAYDWTREGLPDLLHDELEQSRSLRLAGKDRVREIVERLKLDSGGEYPKDTLVTLSRLGSVENVLTGELIRDGDRFRIRAKLVRIGSTEKQLAVDGQGAGSLFSMVDDLSRGIREELGLEKGRGRRKASELSTTSVDALRFHIEAEQLLREGRDNDAAGKLEAAIEKDPDFAVARAQLAEIYAGSGRTDDAVSQVNQAAAALGRVSPYEAERIRAVRATLSNDDKAAREAYDELCRLAPNQAEPHLALASFLEDRSDPKGALESLDRSLALDPRNPTALFARGRVRAKLGDTPEAIADFNSLLAYHEEMGNEEGRATVLMGLGNVNGAEPARALDYYNQALDIRRTLGDLPGAAKALSNIALAQQALGRLDLAIDTMKECLEMRQELGDRLGQATTWSNLGDFYSVSGRAVEARDAYHESLILLENSGDDASYARALGNLGYINQLLGNYVEASLMLNSALRARRELALAEDLVMSLIDVGNLELIQGRFDNAVKHYDEAMTEARRSENKSAQLVLTINMAMLNHERGNYAAALTQATDAEALARETQNRSYQALSLAWLGSSQRALGEYDKAADALDRSLALTRDLGTPGLEAEVLIHQGYLQLAREQKKAAAAVFTEALEKATAAQDHRLKLWAGIGQATATGAASRLAAARDEARKAGLMPLAGLAASALEPIRPDSS